MNTTPFWVPLTVALVTVLGSLIVTWLTLREQRAKLLAEMEFQRKKFEAEILSAQSKIAAEHAVEMSVSKALEHFLSLSELRYRTFSKIRHHIGGFEANHLRQLLVRCGAVRFMASDGTELWALLSRVEDDFRYSRWKHSDVPISKVPDEELFPAAFKDSSQY